MIELDLIENFFIDKSDWIAVKFGDIVYEPKESVKDPIAEGIEHVVGLEHIDSEDIHLRRSASIEESTTFTKRFRKGDVLFGRRRAYLKKAAKADFDGICSGDITVMRANEELLLPELLPFIVNNDKFFDYAIQHSAGGLSPRVKFKDLSSYEVYLPPLDTQVILSDLFSTLDCSQETSLTHVLTLKKAYQTLLNQFMIHGTESFDGDVITTKLGLLDKRLRMIQLKDCLLEKPSYGANASSKSYDEGSPRYIRITDIDDDGRLIDDDLVTIDSKNYNNYILEDNDFLFARTGNTVGKTLLYRSSYGLAVFAGYLIRFKLNDKKLRSKFLFYFTKSLKFESFKRKMVKIGAQPNINSEEYQSMYLPELSVKAQDEVIDKLDNYWEIIDLADSKLQKTKQLRTNLINQVF